MKLKELIEAAKTLVEDVKDELQDIIDETNAPDSDANCRRQEAVDILDDILWPDDDGVEVPDTDVPFKLKATPPRSSKARIRSAIGMVEAAINAIDCAEHNDLCSTLDGIANQLVDVDVPG